MGSCVSKKAARAGAGAGPAAGVRGKVAAPLPQEKENVMSPVVVEEEVKEVVLSETPVTRPPRPPPEPVKMTQGRQVEEEEALEASSAGDSSSVASAKAGAELLMEKRALDAPKGSGARWGTAPEVSTSSKGGDGSRKARSRSPPPATARRRQQVGQAAAESKSMAGSGSGNARSPSPGAARRTQQGGGGQPSAAARPRREQPQPAVVSSFGCRSGRFSPSAARRAAESAAVRRSQSAREADMALPAKRCLAAGINGGHAGAGAYGGGSLTKRDPGERSGRRSDSPTGKRPPASPSPVHRLAGGTRKAANEQRAPEPARPRGRDGGHDAGRGGDDPSLARGEGDGKEVAVDGALGQNPSVAMECFIFL
ncbi:hypothetical protein ACP4OV_007568 [Aristida adscensionis]